MVFHSQGDKHQSLLLRDIMTEHAESGTYNMDNSLKLDRRLRDPSIKDDLARIALLNCLLEPTRKQCDPIFIKASKRIPPMNKDSSYIQRYTAMAKIFAISQDKNPSTK